MRLPLSISTSDPQSISREMTRERDRTNRHISFGNHLDGPDNIEGVWLQEEITGATHTFQHRLDVPISSGTTANVGWLLMGSNTVGQLTHAGGAVTVDSIVLAWSGATPAEVLVFFVRTGDWP